MDNAIVRGQSFLDEIAEEGAQMPALGTPADDSELAGTASAGRKGGTGTLSA